jgi:hypothetical protein
MSEFANVNVEVSSLSESEFVVLLVELQDFLKAKLAPCRNNQGVIYYWTCGVDHFEPPVRYEPFKHLSKFCAKKHLDMTEFKTRIEEYSGMMIHCECFIVNRVRVEKA